MKALLNQFFVAVGMAVTVGSIVIGVLAAMNKYNAIPESLSELRRDPVYRVNISGDVPQIVNQVKVGDDVKPHFYQTWYNPKTGEYSDFIVEVE